MLKHLFYVQFSFKLGNRFTHMNGHPTIRIKWYPFLYFNLFSNLVQNINAKKEIEACAILGNCCFEHYKLQIVTLICILSWKTYYMILY
jgi:hypothetical protein